MLRDVSYLPAEDAAYARARGLVGMADHALAALCRARPDRPASFLYAAWDRTRCFVAGEPLDGAHLGPDAPTMPALSPDDPAPVRLAKLGQAAERVRLAYGEHMVVFVGPPAVAPRLEAVDPELALYLRGHGVPLMVDGWLHALLRARPADPVAWSAEYFRRLAPGRREVTTEVIAAGDLRLPTPDPDPHAESSKGPSGLPPAVAALLAAAPSATLPPRGPGELRVLVAYYSSYGHTEAMAAAAVRDGQAAADAHFGPGSVAVAGRRMAETLAADQQHEMSLSPPRRVVPVATAADVAAADAVLLAFPVRYGGPAAQALAFLEECCWAADGAGRASLLEGKPCAVLVASGSQHGGHERAAVAMHRALLSLGAVVAGPPPPPPSGAGTDSVEGGSCLAAGTVAGLKGERPPSPAELRAAAASVARLAAMAAGMRRAPPDETG